VVVDFAWITEVRLAAHVRSEGPSTTPASTHGRTENGDQPEGAAKAPAAPLPTLASAPSEEVGIVAQEQHGAEVDAALSKASADVTTERATHAEQETKTRAESDAQLQDFKIKADTGQAAARDAAQTEVQTARADWQAQLGKKGADARKQAEGMAQVEASADRSDEPALRARRIRSRVGQGPAAVDRAQAHCKRDCVRLGGG
jgi:hypothetical protein